MPAYFFDRNRTSKKLRQLPKPRLSAAAHYNQLTKSTNMSAALNNNSSRSTVPGTVAISDDELRRSAPSVFASQPIKGVSERYRFLPTSSILDGMRENGWVPVRAQEQSVRTEARRGFQKHVVRFARVEHLQTWEKNQVRPEVVLVNSHDKSSAYQLHCGLFRLVCTNDMVVSDATFQRISIKHSGFNPDSVIEASFKVLNAVPDIMNKVQLFQELHFDRCRTVSSGHWRGGLSLGRPHESPGKSLHAP
jgi:Domain of unknown function (DUF932)